MSSWTDLSDEDVSTMAHTLVTACSRGRAWHTTDEGGPWGPLLDAAEPVRNAAVAELVGRIRERVRGTRFEHDDHGAVYVWHDLLSALLPVTGTWGPTASPAAWSARELAVVINDVARALDEAQIEARWYAAGALIETAARTGPNQPELRSALVALGRSLHRNAHDRDTHAGHRTLDGQIAELLGLESLHPPDAWRRVLLLGDDELGEALLALAAKPPAKPSPRFVARRDKLLGQLGRDACRERLLTWLSALAAAKASSDEPPVVSAETTTTMIGLAHIAAGYDEAPMLAAIADLGIAGYRKVPHFGALAAKLGTACARLLAERPDALPHLARMHQRAAHPPSKAKLAALLEEVAAGLGVSAAELTEIVVDDLGLDGGGCLRRSFEHGSWEMRVADDEIIDRWRIGDQVLESPPPALRKAEPGLVRDLRAHTKAVREALGVQRARVENLLREDREWPYTSWVVRYAEHRLVGTIARRLAWRLGDADGERTVLWLGGGFVNLDGGRIGEPSPDARVRLWHPAGARPGEREAVRAALAAACVRQPFDQVDRHVLEPETADGDVQSVRRFAGTRVRQHQLAAILEGRGWRYELRSALFDSSDEPRLELPAWGISAVATLSDEEPSGETSERGILLEVTLEGVRFLAGDSPLDPHDVPLVAFSEVLRDIALVAHAADADADADAD